MPLSLALSPEGRGNDGCRFAKAGLSHLANDPCWPRRWRSFAESLPAGVAPVAVAYADYHLAAAPPPEEVLGRAIDFGWTAFLIDTFDKQAGRLGDHLSKGGLIQLIRRARAAGMLSVLAGSLDLKSIERIGEWTERPDYVAVRGAACRRGRTSPLDSAKIERIRGILNAASVGN